jgi:hypothetical protein
MSSVILARSLFLDVICKSKTNELIIIMLLIIECLNRMLDAISIMFTEFVKHEIK